MSLHHQFKKTGICALVKQKALGLVMIVKNEVATINTTLGSMRDMIDYWTIVDTGSTDGTQVPSAPMLHTPCAAFFTYAPVFLDHRLMTWKPITRW